jgi:ABC-type uncharacterized transport system permease subunit
LIYRLTKYAMMVKVSKTRKAYAIRLSGPDESAAAYSGVILGNAVGCPTTIVKVDIVDETRGQLRS